MSRSLRPRLAIGGLLAWTICLCGCTSLRDYVHQGFKVGPNYCPPKADVADHWLKTAELRVEDNPTILTRWWTALNDPTLDRLVYCAYHQNLTLRQAGFRILQARANRAIAVGDIFPQQQYMSGNYARGASAGIATSSSITTLGRYNDSWNLGFNLNWELDFWGQFRRAIASADASLDASAAYYDAVLVTLLGDVAQNYVRVRTYQERIALLRENVRLQNGVLEYVESRYRVGKVNKLDLDQATGNLRSTEAGIPALGILQQQAENQICLLLGIPTVDLKNMLGEAPPPTVSPQLVLCIPAELLRRRPDVRQAERNAAAQAEQIGIAAGDLYPAFYINGSFGYSASNFPDLFSNRAFNGSVGPSFHWNLLNYGRIVNNVRLQDARFQELVVAYQNTVLTANKEVEDGLANFLNSQQRHRLLDEGVKANKEAVSIAVSRYKAGTIDFNTYATIEQTLVTQQDTDAQARGDIVQGLIAVYRALGGGWEIRLDDNSTGEAEPPAATPKLQEPVPAPAPSLPGAPSARSSGSSAPVPGATASVVSPLPVVFE
jgi:NodT family efflux transporter outer membrane factor (OMF) lipoprotein